MFFLKHEIKLKKKFRIKQTGDQNVFHMQSPGRQGADH